MLGPKGFLAPTDDFADGLGEFAPRRIAVDVGESDVRRGEVEDEASFMLSRRASLSTSSPSPFRTASMPAAPTIFFPITPAIDLFVILLYALAGRTFDDFPEFLTGFSLNPLTDSLRSMT